MGHGPWLWGHWWRWGRVRVRNGRCGTEWGFSTFMFWGWDLTRGEKQEKNRQFFSLPFLCLLPQPGEGSWRSQIARQVVMIVQIGCSVQKSVQKPCKSHANTIQARQMLCKCCASRVGCANHEQRPCKCAGRANRDVVLGAAAAAPRYVHGRSKSAGWH